MSRKISLVLVLLILASMLVTACQPAAAPDATCGCRTHRGSRRTAAGEGHENPLQLR